MIIEVPMYKASCDRCGDRFDYGDFYAYAERDMAEELAIDGDWVKLDNGRLLCLDCWTWSEDESEQIEKPRTGGPR